jgi:hypothetical protein
MTHRSETNETTLIEAHKAGCAYWRANRPMGKGVTVNKLASLARSCGWHGADCEAWLAGFFGEKRREQSSNTRLDH